MDPFRTILLPIVVCSKKSEIYRINSELGSAKIPMYLLISEGSPVEEYPFQAALENNLVNLYEEGMLPVIILADRLGRETGGQIMSSIMKRFPQGGLFLRTTYESKPMGDAWSGYSDEFGEYQTPKWGYGYFAGPTIREVSDDFLSERGLVTNPELENNR